MPIILKPETADDAVRLGLVDAISYEDEVIDLLKSKIGLDKSKKLKTVKLKDYAKTANQHVDFKVKDKIAIVFAEGNIVDGKGEEGSIGGEKYAKVLRKIRNDEHIKGVVLRVNSGGGSVMASEDILREMNQLKEEGKPVVASFGDVSASGGYYISCQADRILCEPNTITGSIGVFFMAPNLEEMIQDKIGVKFDTVNTGKYSSSFSLVYDWDDKEGRFLQSMTDKHYEDFLDRVARGRNMTRDEVHAIAQGRVWSGRKALEIGLVDELAGLDRAVEIAAELAGLEKYRTSNYPKIKDPLIRMIEDFTGQESPIATEILVKQKLGKEYASYYEALTSLKELKGPQARIPFMININ